MDRRQTMQERTWRIAFVALMVVAMALFAFPVPPAAAAPATVTVNGHGHWAEVVAKTDKPMKFIFSAGKALDYDGGCSGWRDGRTIFGGPTDLWIAPVTDLDPGSNYYFGLQIIDPTGRTPRQCLTGSFKTKKPSVTVKFNTAEIIDDNDAFTSGAGELLFYLGTNGGFHDQLAVGWLEADSGTTVNLNKSIVRTSFIKNESITVHARAIEEDCSWGQFCTNGAPGTELGPDKDSGEDDEYTWVTGGAGPFFILYDDFDPDFGKQRPFTITVESGLYDLCVIIHGTYEVDYD